MSVSDLTPALRTKDVYQHIDMGFLNRRLCMSALPDPIRVHFIKAAEPGSDHFTQLRNDHLLVMMVLDVCEAAKVPTLLEALALGKKRHLFCSTERVEACPAVYSDPRVRQRVVLDIDYGKPVVLAYHTEHIVSSTGRMTLAEGISKGYVESIVGLLHDKIDCFEIEPLVMGAPWLEHPRNGSEGTTLVWFGQDHGELLPEDIDQFSKMREIQTSSAEEWLDIMRATPEAKVKNAFARLLHEPTKKDWGGEANDHFSSSVSIAGARKTAAFLLKGPTQFREMTLDMCGKRADQIYRLTNSGADISVVQHSHLIGEAVRATLRSMTVHPGRPRKYCLIDGQATYRILKAYSLL